MSDDREREQAVDLARRWFADYWADRKGCWTEDEVQMLAGRIAAAAAEARDKALEEAAALCDERADLSLSCAAENEEDDRWDEARDDEVEAAAFSDAAKAIRALR